MSLGDRSEIAASPIEHRPVLVRNVRWLLRCPR